MAQQVTVTAKGLFTSPNQLGEVPDGALAQADNVVISKDGVLEPRRGLVTASSTDVRRLFSFNDVLVGHDPVGNALAASNGAVTSWSDYTGTFAEPSSSVVREAKAGPNLFLTSSAGIRKVDSLGNVYLAGVPMPKIYDITTGAVGGPLAANSACAYRAVLYYLDSNGRKVFGPPSDRYVRINASAGALYAEFSIALPPGNARAWGVHLYRSQLASPSTATPSDELQLSYEGSLPGPSVATTRTRTGGTTVTFTTSTEHGLNTSDVVYIRGTVSGFPSDDFFTVASTPTTTTFTVTNAGANTTTAGDQTIELHRTRYIVDSLADDLLGETIYTAPSQGGAALAKFSPPLVDDIAEFRGSLFAANGVGRLTAMPRLIAVGAPSGVQAGDTVTVGSITVTGTTGAAGANEFFVSTAGTASENIANTAASIAYAVTRAAFAAGIDLVGRYDYFTTSIDSFGQMVFTSSWAGAGPASVSVSRASAFMPGIVTGQVDSWVNGLWWSAPDEPEAWPLLNYARIGSAGAQIVRLVATRDALFIFKEDGIWRLTGSGGSWDIQPIDPTMSCPAPESLVPFENAVFGLLDSGVAKVTESGVEIISTPIYSSLEPLLDPAVKATTESVAFGVAYHSAHKYSLWLPTAAGDTVAKQAFVFDSWTSAWTRWLPPTGVTGFYHGLVNPADDRLYMVDGANVWQERKTSSGADFTDGTATAIPAVVKWSPKVGGNPGGRHHFREVALHFRSVQFTTASIGFATDVSPSEETITLTGTDYGVSTARGPTVIRALVPLEKSRGSQLRVKFSHANAGMTYELEGLSVVFNPGSTRVGR